MALCPNWTSDDICMQIHTVIKILVIVAVVLYYMCVCVFVTVLRHFQDYMLSIVCVCDSPATV